jgi:hypothetical protein
MIWSRITNLCLFVCLFVIFDTNCWSFFFFFFGFIQSFILVWLNTIKYSFIQYLISFMYPTESLHWSIRIQPNRVISLSLSNITSLSNQQWSMFTDHISLNCVQVLLLHFILLFDFVLVVSWKWKQTTKRAHHSTSIASLPTNQPTNPKTSRSTTDKPIDSIRFNCTPIKLSVSLWIPNEPNNHSINTPLNHTITSTCDGWHNKQTNKTVKDHWWRTESINQRESDKVWFDWMFVLFNSSNTSFSCVLMLMKLSVCDCIVWLSLCCCQS